MRILGFSSRDTIEEWSADIFVRNAGVVNTEADKNVRAPEKPKMRTRATSFLAVLADGAHIVSE